MKKQLIILLGTLGLLFSFTSNAATVTDDGLLSLDITNANEISLVDGVPPEGNNVIGAIDGYSNAILIFEEDVRYDFTYLGHESGDVNTFSFTAGDLGSFNSATSAEGDVITANGIVEADSWLFGGSGSPDTSDPSLDIFMVVVGNLVLLGFDDRMASQVAWGHVDYDDMVVAVSASAIPVPAAVWLFGTAMLGLFGMRRKSKMEAVAA